MLQRKKKMNSLHLIFTFLHAGLAFVMHSLNSRPMFQFKEQYSQLHFFLFHAGIQGVSVGAHATGHREDPSAHL